MMPRSDAPARQSRRVSHQPRQKSTAGIDTHQIAGFPSGRTSWDHDGPGGQPVAGQGWVPAALV